MTRSVVTFGSFDGVHVGHAALVRAAAVRARDLGLSRVVAVCFQPHPRSVLRPEAVPSVLSTRQQRRHWLAQAGASEVAFLRPTPELLAAGPEEFMAWMQAELCPAVVVEGQSFRFGRGRAGDMRLLREAGARAGFEVMEVPPVEVTLDDHSVVVASSSICRWLLASGRVADAARVLGRPYEVAGVVERGDRRGREMGFPTANIHWHTTLPAAGVYAAWAVLPDGSRWPAAVNIGERPTFAGRTYTCEAHLLGVTAQPGGAISGLPEYGWPIRLQMIRWIRDQVRFPSLPQLLDQIQRDCQRVGGAVGAATMAHA